MTLALLSASVLETFCVEAKAALGADAFTSVLNYGSRLLAAECNAGKCNIGIVDFIAASCGVNEYENVLYETLRTVVCISNSDGNALTCGNCNCCTAPGCICPRVAANGADVTSVCTGFCACGNPSCTLNVNANSGICRAVVCDCESKGVLTKCKSADFGSSNGLVCAALAVILNVETVYLVAGVCFGVEVELETCVLYGRSNCVTLALFSASALKASRVEAKAALGTYALAYVVRIGLYGSVLAAESNLGNNDSACMSCIIVPLAAVNHDLNVGGELGCVVNNYESSGSACFDNEGGSAPFLICVNLYAVLSSGNVTAGGVGACLSTAFNINANLNGFCAGVCNLHCVGVLCSCDRGSVEPNVLVGVTYDICVFNLDGGVIVVYVYAVAVAGVTADGNLFAFDNRGEIAGYGIFYGRSGHIFAAAVALTVIVCVLALVGSYYLTNRRELNVLDCNVAGTKVAVVSGGVDHKLKLNAANAKVNNELCSLACGNVEEGSAPFKVRSNCNAVHCSGDVSSLIVACKRGVEHINANVNCFCAVVCNCEMYVVLARYRVGNVKLDRHISATGYVGVCYASLCALNYYVVGSYRGEVGNDRIDLCPIDLRGLAALGRINCGRIEGSALCACSDPLILCSVILCFACVLAHPSPSSFVTAPVVGEDSTCCGGELFNDSYVACFLHGGICGYLINGLAVYKPSDGCLCPAEAVGVEFLGSVEAKVVHILVTALAVNEEVELNVSCILTEELDIDLIVRIGNAVLGIVRTCANEESTSRTGVSGGLHRYFVVAVMIIVL